MAPTALTCQIPTIREGWSEVVDLFSTSHASRGYTQYGVTFELVGVSVNIINAADLALPATYRFPELVSDYCDRLEGTKRDASILSQRLREWPLDGSTGDPADDSTDGSFQGEPTTFNQLANVERILSADPTSRQAVVSAWDPAIDAQSRFPISPIAGSFRVLDDELHTMLVARSTDVLVGLVPELIGWAAHGASLAQRLTLRGHSMTYHCWNLHMYEIDYVGMGF